MTDLIKAANQTCNLNELFEIKNKEIVDIVIKIIRKGWWVFLAVSILLSLSGPAFVFSIFTFLTNPVGLIILGIFGATAATVLRKLYRDRKLPLAIKKVGSKYQPLYEKIKDGESNLDIRRQKIDSLLEDGVIDLVSKAKTLSKQEKQELEKVLEKKLLFWRN